MFSRINLGQWHWYLHNFIKDEEEGYSKRRDMTEYLASFSNPEAVQRIRGARDDSVKVSDKEFGQGMKHIFGREFPKDMKRGDGKMHAASPKSVMKGLQDGGESSTTYKDWMDVNLE